MEQAEISIFIALSAAILLIFIGGILMFIIQYRHRRILHDKETAMLTETHHRELLQAQLQIQTQTMQDIGREIHDNVGQRLTLASIYANQMLASNPENDERLKSIGSIINDSLAELRALSKSLVSEEADSAELAAILGRECERVKALNICGLECHMTDEHFAISATVKNFIVRIAQEALQNSLKHAACKHIDLRLEYDEAAGVTLSISDDGKGFDPTLPATGIGLQNMRQRAALVGGNLAIESKPGLGTSLLLTIPPQKMQTA